MTITKPYLDIEEIRQLEDAATCLRDRLLIRLLARLGCRVSEALSLSVEDIDFARGMVTIEHLKVRLKLTCPHCSARLGKTHVFCPKCGSKIDQAIVAEQKHRRMRTLPLDQATLDLLKDYIERGGAVKRNGQQLLFGISRGHAWKIISDYAEDAGLPRLANPETGQIHNVSPHRLRDAFAVHAVKLDDSGDGLRLLQEHLGHASFNTTAKYRKVAGQELKEWYDKLWEKETNAT